MTKNGKELLACMVFVMLCLVLAGGGKLANGLLVKESLSQQEQANWRSVAGGISTELPKEYGEAWRELSDRSPQLLLMAATSRLKAAGVQERRQEVAIDSDFATLALGMYKPAAR